MRALSAEEIANLGRIKVSPQEHRRNDIDWLYNDPEATKQILEGKTVVTSSGRVWQVTYEGDKVIYRQMGKLVPMGNVHLSRFKAPDA